MESNKKNQKQYKKQEKQDKKQGKQKEQKEQKSENECFYIKDDKIMLVIKGKPNRRECKVIGIEDECLVIGVDAAAQDGAANKALVHYLAQMFQVARGQVVIQRGATTSHKLVAINSHNYTLQQVAHIIYAQINT